MAQWSPMPVSKKSGNDDGDGEIKKERERWCGIFPRIKKKKDEY